MSTYEKKSGHPVLGLILGILGIVVALLLCLISGVIGGAVAGVLGLAALLIGILGKKGGGKGIGAIIAGVLAVLLAVVMTISTVDAMKQWKQKAEQTGEAPLLVKYLDKPELGLLGIIVNMPKDEGSVQDLMDELEKLRQS